MALTIGCPTVACNDWLRGWPCEGTWPRNLCPERAEQASPDWGTIRANKHSECRFFLVFHVLSERAHHDLRKEFTRVQRLVMRLNRSSAQSHDIAWPPQAGQR